VIRREQWFFNRREGHIRPRECDHANGLQNKASSRREMGTVEAVFFKLAGITAAWILIRVKLNGSLDRNFYLGLTAFGRAHVEHGKREHEQSHEFDPARHFQ